MTRGKAKNLPASVRRRLLNLAEKRGEPFQRVLVQYGLERLLYRISRSEHRDRFVLKGALLFSIWSDTPHRPTMDVDLMSAATADTAELAAAFGAILAAPVEPDGLEFFPNSVRAEEIRETHAYAGVRIRLLARLEAARIDLQVDIGFADAITPGPVDLSYPTMLEFPSPRLKAYPRETVVAEKFEAAVSLGTQMPKRIMPGLLRAGGAELLQQLPELVLDAGEFHQRRFTAQQAPEREQHQQRLMHRAPVPLLPDANAVERSQDFVAGHGQYFAFCGKIQRTPPRGSSLSPA